MELLCTLRERQTLADALAACASDTPTVSYVPYSARQNLSALVVESEAVLVVPASRQAWSGRVSRAALQSALDRERGAMTLHADGQTLYVDGRPLGAVELPSERVRGWLDQSAASYGRAIYGFKRGWLLVAVPHQRAYVPVTLFTALELSALLEDPHGR